MPEIWICNFTTDGSGSSLSKIRIRDKCRFFKRSLVFLISTTGKNDIQTDLERHRQPPLTALQVIRPFKATRVVGVGWKCWLWRKRVRIRYWGNILFILPFRVIRYLLFAILIFNDFYIQIRWFPKFKDFLAYLLHVIAVISCENIWFSNMFSDINVTLFNTKHFFICISLLVCGGNIFFVRKHS